MTDSTTEMLQKHFDLALEAPDGITKLRELILTLAMRGKLVPQDPNDPPASELLRRIDSAWTSGRVTKFPPKASLGGRDEEVHQPTIPGSWSWTELARIVRILNGRAYKQDEMLDAGTPILRVGNLFTSDKWYYSNLELDQDKYVDRGDLIYSWSASFGPFVWQGPRVIYHYHIWKVDPISPENISIDFLKLFLDSVTKTIKASGHGISMVHMTKERMERLQVPLPPLPEQRRIVAKIDQLMAVCDDLEKKRDALVQKHLAVHNAAIRRLLEVEEASEFSSAWDFLVEHFGEVYSVKENVAELRKAILQLAIKGKLVKQDPNDPPASELLKEIEAEKRRLVKEGKIKAPKPLPPIAPEEVPFAVPSGWEWQRLEALFITSGGIQKTPSRAPKDNAFPYVGVSNVLRGRVDLSKVDHFELLPGELEKKHLETGDLLVIEGNGSLSEIGRCAIWEGAIENCVHQNHIIRCRPQKTEVGPFILLQMNSPYGISEMQRLAITTSGLYNLSVGKIQQFILVIPPLPEQHRIVAKVNQLMALCDTLERQINASTNQKSAILNAVLAQV